MRSYKEKLLHSDTSNEGKKVKKEASKKQSKATSLVRRKTSDLEEDEL
jgi:hypothetical protein